jgi:hypothetical protein
MRYLVLLLAVAFIGCQSREEQAVQQTIDSIVYPSAPVNVGAPFEVDSSSGLLIDRSRMRSPEHNQTLARFQDPKEITQIYRDFRPLRKPGLEKSRVDSFLSAKKITLKELQTILAEGDQLKWNKVDSNGRPLK